YAEENASEAERAQQVWGRWQVVTDRQNADLILLLSAHQYNGGYITNTSGRIDENGNVNTTSNTTSHAKKLLVIFGLATCAVPAYAAKGIVTHRISGCDYFVVETSKGYDLLEWYGGWDPDKGDVLVGVFEQYGMHDINDPTVD